ncbi:MAG: S-methyl-5'-thioadenosine phosphorylase [Dehalococcoidales bacterium]
MPEARIGVIGGSGFYNMPGIEDVKEVPVDTPFGKPSDALTIGRLEGVSVAFLPRHDRGHTVTPGELNSRANIYALKSLGVERIIAVTACGSFKEELAPGDLVIPDQIIDRTKGRPSSFFGDGIVGHVLFDEPFCPELSRLLYQTGREVGGVTIHQGGTFLTMEGPAFSTRAESRLHKSWGVDIIGMTAAPEAKLAREAEICYASIAGVTDYDCWKDDDEPTPIDQIIATLRRNTDTIREIIRRAVAAVREERTCGCASALRTAIVTSPDAITPALKKKLDLIIGKYIK